MPDPGVLERILLAEYSELKREQVDRIGRRDQLVYANLTAVAGVLAAALTHTGPAGLLLLPPVCLILGWTYVRNDRHVAHIKTYLRNDLGPRLTTLAGGPVLGWENGPRRRRRMQVVVEFVTFVVPAAAAVVGYVSVTPWHGHLWSALVPVWAAEWTAICAFTFSLFFGGGDTR